MRAAFDEDDDEEELEHDPSAPDTSTVRELTLSNTMLVGMLFGLLLLCGLFFGWGFSMGRHVSADSSPERGLADSIGASSAAELVSQSSKVSASQAKPSAFSQTASAIPDSSSPDPVQDSKPDAGHDTEQAQAKIPDSQNQSASAPENSAQAPRAAYVPVQTSVAAKSPLLASAASGSMVQIAAVSNIADANVLLGALRKRGYSVSVRRDPTDALMHVQVGPFSNRDDAVLMRQKLLSDGYNAILK